MSIVKYSLATTDKYFFFDINNNIIDKISHEGVIINIDELSPSKKEKLHKIYSPFKRKQIIPVMLMAHSIEEDEEDEEEEEEEEEGADIHKPHIIMSAEDYLVAHPYHNSPKKYIIGLTTGERENITHRQKWDVIESDCPRRIPYKCPPPHIKCVKNPRECADADLMKMITLINPSGGLSSTYISNPRFRSLLEDEYKQLIDIRSKSPDRRVRPKRGEKEHHRLAADRMGSYISSEDIAKIRNKYMAHGK